MKAHHLISCLLASALCLFSPSIGTASTHASLTPLNRVIAIVNNDVITSQELEGRVNIVKQQLEKRGTDTPSLSVLEPQVLEQMILQKIQQQWADRAGIHITQKQLTDAIKTIADTNHVTVAKLKENIETAGTSWRKYRNEIRNELKVSQLQRLEVASKIKISSQEVDKLLAEQKQQKTPEKHYHVHNILIALPSNPSSKQVQNAQSEANALLNKIRSHKLSFAKAAASHSKGKQAFKGGDLGWRSLAELPDIFAAEVKTMKPGDVAGPIRAENGYHLLLLSDTKAPQTLTQKERKRQIHAMLFRRRFEEQLDSWLQQARSSAFVEVKKQ